MAQYRFDFLSLRDDPISRQNVECENDQDAIERGLGLLAQDHGTFAAFTPAVIRSSVHRATGVLVAESAKHRRCGLGMPIVR